MSGGYHISQNPINYVQKNPLPNINQTIAFLKDGFLQPSSISPQNTISGGSITYTPTQLLYRYIVRTNLGGSNVTDIMPSASSIIDSLNQNSAVHANAQQQGVTKTIQPGFYFDFMVTNWMG